MFNLQFWYKLHRWISFICATFLVLLCLTGLPLIFKNEIHDLNLQHPQKAHEAIGYTDIWQHVTDGEQTILAKHPDKNIKAISVQPQEGRMLYRVQDKNNHSVVNARMSMGGQQISYYPEDSSMDMHHNSAVKSPFVSKFMHVMHIIHLRLGLGSGGMIFLGVMCFLSFLSVVTGLALYAPFMKKARFASINKNTSMNKWLSWHNFCGVITACWAGILCFSGVMIVVFTLGYGHYIDNSKLAAKANLPVTADVADFTLPTAIKYINQEFPDKYILSVDMPDKKTNNSQYVFYLTNAKEKPDEFIGQLVFVGKDGSNNIQSYTEPLPLYLQFAAVMLNLHIHNHDNIVLQILWAIIDIITIATIISGIMLWWRKSHNIIYQRSFKPSKMLNSWQIWQFPIYIAVLSLIGLIAPLSPSGIYIGLIAWILAFALGIVQFIKEN